MINITQLGESPLQDEVVETSTDRPYGLCLNESEMGRRDGCTLRIARYERATQIALSDASGSLLASHVYMPQEGNRERLLVIWEEKIVEMFGKDYDRDDITYVLRNS